MNLDDYGQKQLDRRVALGREAVELGDESCEWDYDDSGDDDSAVADDIRGCIETNASDVISDILTAVYGPRGYYRYSNDAVSEFVGDDGIVAQAQELLDRSLRSWEGDAEDYSVGNDDSSPEPQLVPAYSADAVEKIRVRLNAVSAQYADEVEPGVSDNSVLEAERDTLEWVLATLSE